MLDSSLQVVQARLCAHPPARLQHDPQRGFPEPDHRAAVRRRPEHQLPRIHLQHVRQAVGGRHSESGRRGDHLPFEKCQIVNVSLSAISVCPAHQHPQEARRREVSSDRADFLPQLQGNGHFNTSKLIQQIFSPCLQR